MKKTALVTLVALLLLIGSSYGWMSIEAGQLLSPRQYLYMIDAHVMNLFPLHRSIDKTPVESTLRQPLADGRAETRMELNTGGDQMSDRRTQVGLVLIVRYAGKELSQIIASCDDAGGGTALFDRTDTVLDVYVCDADIYQLMTGNGHVWVEKNPDTQSKEIVTEIRLPEGIKKAVHTAL